MKSISEKINSATKFRQQHQLQMLLNLLALITAITVVFITIGACTTPSGVSPKKMDPATSVSKESWRMHEVSIVSVFDQHLIMGSPFEPYRQGIAYDAKKTAAMIQIVPTSDSAAFNKQSLRIMVRKDFPLSGKANPEQISKAFESIATSGCGDKRMSIPIDTGSDKVVATVGSCKSLVEKNGTEVALNVYFASSRNFYIIFWSELLAKDASVNLEDPIWSARLRQLMPLYVCPKETASKGMHACIGEYMDLKKVADRR